MTTTPPTFSKAYAALGDGLEAARAAFLAANPDYSTTSVLDDLRRREYGRLDRLGHTYLDYTGGSIYGQSQLDAHMALLANDVYGNPHSHNPTSQAMTDLVEGARGAVLRFFNADPDEYTAIFTANASGALKLVGEAYPFGPQSTFAILADNHNSVNGIREYARAAEAGVCYEPLTLPDLRMDEAALMDCLSHTGPGPNLFAFPGQSNFSGVKHPLAWIARAQALGWDVLLDAAAYVPTNRLDLGTHKPEFVSLSFYKMFGYPTGVGCLLAKREALQRLRRPWFAGGTITIASVGAGQHFLAEGEAAFEDGTVNYLTLPAVEIGLQYLSEIGMATITRRVTALTGWLIENLMALRHDDGSRLVRVHGPVDLDRRGGTVTITVYDPEGLPVQDRRVEQLAGRLGISLRTGCFCNPGTGESTHHIEADLMADLFRADHKLQYFELVDRLAAHGKHISAIRISLGIASNFDDVYRLVAFLRRFLNHTVREIGAAGAPEDPHLLRDVV